MSKFNIEQDEQLQELQRRFTEDCKILFPEYKLESMEVFCPAAIHCGGKEVNIRFNLVQRYDLI